WIYGDGFHSCPPGVTSVVPNTGPVAGGTAITVTGTAFDSGATLKIGGVAATSVVRVNATTITANPPAGGGTLHLLVTNPDAQTGALSNGFQYTGASPPSVSSITPHAGLISGGTSVTVSGANFVSGATVTIGGVAASNVNFVNSTTLTAQTAAHVAASV